MRGRRSAYFVRPPAVLFVEDWHWDAFTYLAARLQREGIASIRVTTAQTTPKSLLGRLMVRLVFRHVLLGTGPDTIAALGSLAERYTIVDVQPAESVAEFAFAFAATLPARHPSANWRARAGLADKIDGVLGLGGADVSVPAKLLAKEVGAEEAIERLGLPIVWKPRVGNGGNGVEIVVDAQRLRALSVSPDARSSFYERFVEGERFGFGGLATDAGVAMWVAFAHRACEKPYGISTAVEIVDEPSVAAAGKALLDATGMNGLLNLDIIKDARGVCWVHDINPRAWGCMAAFAPLGVDFAGAYVAHLLGVLPQPTMPPVPGGVTRIFPAALREPARDPQVLRDFAAWLWSERRRAGLRYLLFVVVTNRQLLRRGLPAPTET